MVVGEVKRHPHLRPERRDVSAGMREAFDAQAGGPLPARPRGEYPDVGGGERRIDDTVGPVLDVDAALGRERLGPGGVALAAGDAEPQQWPRSARFRLRRHHAGRCACRLRAHLAALDDDRARAPSRELAGHGAADHPAPDDHDIRGPSHGGGAESGANPSSVITIVCSAR